FALLFILPWTLKTGKTAFIITGPSLYIGRAIVVALGVILWYIALSQMSLVQVVAFKYTTPLFTLLGAHLFLRENCDWGRGSAILFSFIGALLVSGGDFFEGNARWQDLSLLTLYPLSATACHALAAIFGKKQSRKNSPQTITLYLLLLTLPLFAIASLSEWITPLAWQWPWLIFMGGLLACAYISLGQAYVSTEIIYLIPVSFTRLIAAATIGMAFFHEWPTPWTWMGSFLILGATIALCHYEMKRKTLSTA
ncbi:MAG: DMT family transporter, partial [Alphaproteobacteria bacterium]|nr:DMT family transporter [Alphaproteobacteria bacterium]